MTFAAQSGSVEVMTVLLEIGISAEEKDKVKSVSCRFVCNLFLGVCCLGFEICL